MKFQRMVKGVVRMQAVVMSKLHAKTWAIEIYVTISFVCLMGSVEVGAAHRYLQRTISAARLCLLVITALALLIRSKKYSKQRKRRNNKTLKSYKIKKNQQPLLLKTKSRQKTLTNRRQKTNLSLLRRLLSCHAMYLEQLTAVMEWPASMTETASVAAVPFLSEVTTTKTRNAACHSLVATCAQLLSMS